LRSCDWCIFLRDALNPVAEFTQAFSEASTELRDLFAPKEEHGNSEDNDEVRRREQIFQHDDEAPLKVGTLSVPEEGLDG
jgi:hypothetical protein